MVAFRSRGIVCAIVLAACFGGGRADDAPPTTPLDIVKPLVDSRNLAEAERVARELVAKALSSTGNDSLETARALDALVHVLLAVTDASFEEMRRTAERAVAIKEARLGRQNLEFATSLNNLGRVHLFTGNHEGARASFEEVARIRETLLGSRNLEVGKALNNVAVALVRLGEHAAARPIYERVIAIFKEAGVRDYPEQSTIKTNLAILLKLAGDHGTARTLFDQVLKSQEAALGPDSPQVAGTLGNLGDLCFVMNDMEAARLHWERVRAIWAKDPGPGSSAYAVASANLGNILLRTGELAQGAKLIDEALATFVKLGLMETKEAAVLLHFKAGALALQGDMPGARDHYLRALERVRAIYGENHPFVADHAFHLAEHLFRMHETGPALTQALVSERITREHLRQTFPVLSEREALNYEMARRRGVDLALTILLEKMPTRELQDGIAQSWDSIVRSRAIVLGEMAARQREGRGVSSAQGQTAADRLAVARGRVSRLLVRGPPSQDQDAYRHELQARLEEREQAERDFAQVNASYRRLLASERVGLAGVIDSLPKGTALVAYFTFSRSSPLPGMQPVESYAALTVDAATRQPRLVHLGPASTIEASVARWRQEAGTEPRLDSRAREQAYLSVAKELRSLIWDPAWSTLRHPSRVLVVPDGAINLVSLAALADEKDGYLVESGPTFHYISAERDAVRAPGLSTGSGELLIVGGPDFDSSPSTAGAPPRPSVPTSSLRGPRGLCAALAALDFEPLPQARTEADEVASMWASSGPVRKLTGAEADEATFKAAAAGARAIHLATHAFFMAPQCHPEGPASPTESASSLIFSGLALAGANRRVESAANEQGEDGILTAEEIGGMDLSGVEWVVLSACETGVGKALSGEGVLGLRRAFEVATTGSLIMSLWKVEDDVTRVWMSRLYRNRLDGLSAADSVRKASLEALKARRSHGLSAHPFFWGAFVASGDWQEPRRNPS
ncbi:MAG: CHAT domain-containing protein [Candidatus Polarisedimenticolia bacterium]